MPDLLSRHRSIRVDKDEPEETWGRKSNVRMEAALTPDQCKKCRRFLRFFIRYAVLQIHSGRQVDASAIFAAWNISEWGRSQHSGQFFDKVGMKTWDETITSHLIALRASGLTYSEIDTILGVPNHASCRAVSRLMLADKIQAKIADNTRLQNMPKKRRKKIVKSC